MKLSIIYPMYNEEGNIDELLQRTLDTLEQNHTQIDIFEIICIDDKSEDNTKNKIQLWMEKDKRIKGLFLEVHKGHPKAIQAGFNAIFEGDYTLLSNADLQYRPEEIINFVEKLLTQPNMIIINGWRTKKIDSFLKKITSKIYNYLSRKYFKTELHDHAVNFTLYKSNHIKDIQLDENDQRYIIAKLKFKYKLTNNQITEIPIIHLPRKYGKSKYPVWRKIILGFFEIQKKKKQIEKEFQ